LANPELSSRHLLEAPSQSSITPCISPYAAPGRPNPGKLQPLASITGIPPARSNLPNHVEMRSILPFLPRKDKPPGLGCGRSPILRLFRAIAHFANDKCDGLCSAPSATLSKSLSHVMGMTVRLDKLATGKQWMRKAHENTAGQHIRQFNTLGNIICSSCHNTQRCYARIGQSTSCRTSTRKM
jgi:hypothetical protein